MKRVCALFSVMLFIGLLVVCSKKSNPTDTDENTMIWTYTLSHDTLIVTQPADTSTDSYCNGSSLVSETYVDSASKDTSALTFSANGDTMTSIGTNDTTVLCRVGSGTGVQGTWSGSSYGMDIQVVVTGATITITQTNSCPADEFLAQDFIDTAEYAVTVTKLSCSQIRLVGNSNSQQVTVTINSNYDITFSGSGHTSGTLYANPTSCPNEPPDWFITFLGSNYKGTYKKAVTTPAVAIDMQKKMRLLKNKRRHLL